MELSKELELLRESWTETFDQLFVLYEIAREVAFNLEMESVLDNVATHAFMLMEAEAGAILLLNPATNKLDFKVIKSEKADIMQKLDLHLAVGEGIAGSVVQTKQPVIIPETSSADPRLKQEQLFFSLVAAKTILCVPIMLRSQAIGAIEVVNKKKGSFTVKDRDFMLAIANISAIAFENAKVYRQLQNTQGYQAQILDNLPDGFLAVNTQGRVTHVNARAIKSLGMTEKGVVDEMYSVILASEPELMQCIRLALQEGEVMRWRELTLRTTGVPVYLSTFLLKEPEGKISGAGVVLQDMVLRR